MADGYTWWNVSTPARAGWVPIGNWLVTCQLGEFDFRLRLLRFDFKPNYSKVVDTIRALAEMQNRVVAEILSRQGSKIPNLIHQVEN